MPRRNFDSTFMMVVRQLSHYEYTGRQNFSNISSQQDFAFEFRGGSARKVYLSSPVTVNNGDNVELISRVDQFMKGGAFQAQAEGQLILPIIWSERIEHSALADNALSGKGLLVLTTKKEAQWVGVITTEFSKQLANVLAERGFTLAEGAACLDIKSEVTSSHVNTVPRNVLVFFENFFGALYQNDETVLSDGTANLAAVDFYKVKERGFNLRCAELGVTAVDLIRNTVDEIPEVDSCTLDSRLFYFSMENLPDTIAQKLLEFKTPGIDRNERNKEFSRYVFSCILYSLVNDEQFMMAYHKKFANFIRRYGEFYTITLFVCRVISDVIYPCMPDDTLTTEVVKKNFKEAVKAVSSIAILKLQFYGVYKQLLDQIDSVKDDNSELQNILNFLSIIFNRKCDDSQPVSAEVVIKFLNEFFFPWSESLESYFPAVAVSLEEDSANRILKYFTDIANAVSALNVILMSVSDFLGQLSLELSGRDKTIEDYSADIHSASPQQQYLKYQQYLILSGDSADSSSVKGDEEDHSLSLLEDPDISIIPHGSSGADDENSTSVSTDFNTATVTNRPMLLPVRYGVATAGIPKTAIGLTDRLEGLEPAIVEQAVVPVGAAATSAAESASIITGDNSLAAETIGFGSERASALHMPKQASESVPCLYGDNSAAAVVKKSGGSAGISQASAAEQPSRWGYVGRVALGVLGLVLITGFVLAVVAATKGGALIPLAKAAPWLVNSVLQPMGAFIVANVEAAMCVTAATVAVSGICIKEAVKPNLLSRAWSWMRGKSAEAAVGAGHAHSSTATNVVGSTAAMLQAPGSKVQVKAESVVGPRGTSMHGSVVESSHAEEASVEEGETRSCWPCLGLREGGSSS